MALSKVSGEGVGGRTRTWLLLAGVVSKKWLDDVLGVEAAFRRAHADLKVAATLSIQILDTTLSTVFLGRGWLGALRPSAFRTAFAGF
jgi:hypothetical protein